MKFLEQLNNEFANIVDEVENNSPLASSLVHALKGVSGNLGAKALFEICKEIDLYYKANELVPQDNILIFKKELENIKNELYKLHSIHSSNANQEVFSQMSFLRS